MIDALEIKCIVIFGEFPQNHDPNNFCCFCEKFAVYEWI